MLSKAEERVDKYPGFQWEWRKYCGLNGTPEERIVRDWVTKLIDLEKPTDKQRLVLSHAGAYLTAFDLPSAVLKQNKAELFKAVKADMEEAGVKY